MVYGAGAVRTSVYFLLDTSLCQKQQHQNHHFHMGSQIIKHKKQVYIKHN